MVESRRVPGKARIRASAEKLSEEYQKKVELVWVSKKSRIRVSTNKLSGQVPENVRISVSTKKR